VFFGGPGSERSETIYARAASGYRRPTGARPKLDAWVGSIEQILEQDPTRPRKQRHTAKRIFDWVKEEHGFTGGYSIVKDYARMRKLTSRRCSCRCNIPPRDAQPDFGKPSW
jgi:transposase